VRAVVLEGDRAVAVRQVPDAALPGPDGAVVVVERTAICGSDLHLYHEGTAFAGVRLGHEVVGTVAETGPEVRTLRPGDRVLVSGIVACGHCPACLAGDPVVCLEGQMAALGTSHALPGGQAEALGVPAADRFALAVPEDVTTEQAVLLTDILPTGYLGALGAAIRPGEDVAVIGLGPVGLMALQCAQLFGPARIFAVDVVEDRLRRAASFGAEPVDATGGQGVTAVLEATGGRGVASVIEAVGLDATIVDALSCAAPGGTVSVIGVNLSMDLPFPMALAFLRRLTLRAQVASIPGTWATLLPLLRAGRIRTDGVFTHQLPLSAADEAYRLFDARSDGVLKVLLDPTR
jgi:threonine dehydrogenase-like Zn-dependent dehydrogenase